MVRSSLLALIFLSAPLAAHAFDGAVDYKITAEGRTMNMTYRLNGDRLRIEFASPEMPGGGVMLRLPAEHATYVLMPERKMALRTDTRQAEARGKKATPGDGEFTKTDRTETIAGQKCVVYTFKSGDSQGEMCNAEGMGNFYFSGAKPKGDEAPAWARDLAAKGLFPLRVDSRTREGKTMNMIATRIDRKAQAAALFQVPPGYKVMDSSAMGMGAAPGAGGAAGFDPAEMATRMQNASPEERRKMIEEMQKQYGAPKP